MSTLRRTGFVVTTYHLVDGNLKTNTMPFDTVEGAVAYAEGIECLQYKILDDVERIVTCSGITCSHSDTIYGSIY